MKKMERARSAVVVYMIEVMVMDSDLKVSFFCPKVIQSLIIYIHCRSSC